MTDTKKPRVFEYSLGQLEGAILAIEKDGVKLTHKIHNVGLSIIRLWGKREIEPQKAADLFTALAKASPYHGKAVSNWIKMHTPCDWSDEAKGFFAHAESRVNGDNFKAARDNPFWEVTPPPNVKPFDGLDLLKALLTKNAARATKGVEGDKLLPNSLVLAIRQAMEQEEVEPNF